MELPVNHEEAEQYAAMHQEDSNLARCYLAMKLQVGALQKQLRTAQEVINKHATDGIEGLHCVDCVAEEDEMCDCPMLVPFWEAMKGFTS